MSEKSADPVSLLTRLSKVALEAGNLVEPDGRHHLGFRYLSAAKVKSILGPIIARHGIAITAEPKIIHRETQQASNKIIDRVTVQTTLHFHCGATWESVSTVGLGNASDVNDSAVMKAVSVAEKYAYISAFCIASGDDADDQREPRSRERRRGKNDNGRGRQEQEQERGGSAKAAEPAAQPRRGEVALRELKQLNTLEAIAGWYRHWLGNGAPMDWLRKTALAALEPMGVTKEKFEAAIAAPQAPASEEPSGAKANEKESK